MSNGLAYDIRPLADAAVPEAEAELTPGQRYKQELLQRYGQPCGQYQFPREWIEADKRKANDS